MRMGTTTFDYHKDREKTLAARAKGMFTVGDIGYLDAAATCTSATARAT